MNRPLIGLTGRVRTTDQIAGMSANMHGVPVDLFVRYYTDAVLAAGGLPVLLSSGVDPAEIVGAVDGLLFSGGADLHPGRYGAQPDPGLGPVEPERDAFELALVELAMARDVPVLGICRGLQLLNVWGGGTLHQDLPEHARYDLAPDAAVETVTVVPGTRLAQLYAPQDRLHVNSLHHQAVDRLAEGWIVTARLGDGTIEGIEWPGHDVIAVQWHPEMLTGAGTDPLFGWLVERAAARGSGVAVASSGGAGATR